MVLPLTTMWFSVTTVNTKKSMVNQYIYIFRPLNFFTFLNHNVSNITLVITKQIPFEHNRAFLFKFEAVK